MGKTLGQRLLLKLSNYFQFIPKLEFAPIKNSTEVNSDFINKYAHLKTFPNQPFHFTVVKVTQHTNVHNPKRISKTSLEINFHLYTQAIRRRIYFLWTRQSPYQGFLVAAHHIHTRTHTHTLAHVLFNVCVCIVCDDM